jgi:hypothetical protein
MEKWRLEPARDLGVPLGKSLRSLQRESGLVTVIARLGWWSTVRAYLALGHRLSIRGREHLPVAPPFVIVANHTSHLDALVLAAALPRRLWDRVFPIAAGDTFFETPLLAAFAAVGLNSLPMGRRLVQVRPGHDRRPDRSACRSRLRRGGVRSAATWAAASPAPQDPRPHRSAASLSGRDQRPGGLERDQPMCRGSGAPPGRRTFGGLLVTPGS